MSYPTPETDVEDFLIAYLVPLGILPSAAQFSARVTANLTGLTPPFVLLQRVAGGDDFIVDRPTVDIESFDTDQTSASTIARQIDHAMRQLRAKTPVTMPDGSMVTPYGPTTVDQRPVFEPWEPSGGGAVLARYIGRYRPLLRLPSISGF